MAEGDDTTDQSQKTEDPTPRKLEEARKKGQVVYSREVNNWMMLFAATVLIVMAGSSLMTDMALLLKQFIASPHLLPADPRGLKNLLSDVLLEIASILALPFGALIAVALLSGFIQTGPIFTADPLKPDLSKLSPIKGFSRLFSSKSIAEFVKGIFKLVIVSAIAVTVLWPYFKGAEHFVGMDFSLALFDMKNIFLEMMVAVLSILFFIAVLDYMYQRYSFIQQMKMSRQEIKDEFKQTEGDPQIKARLRQLREQKARQRMMQAVPESDVVITNPTHYAIALKYDPQDMQAPVMVAKGIDQIALNIKEVAEEHDITIVENPPLARALFDGMDIDEMIPQEHWKAVAEVISYVFKLKGKKA